MNPLKKSELQEKDFSESAVIGGNCFFFLQLSSQFYCHPSFRLRDEWRFVAATEVNTSRDAFVAATVA